MTKEEHKQSSQDESDWSQWFDDEFSTIYRQYQQQQHQEEVSIIKPVSASQLSTLHGSPPLHHDNDTIQKHPNTSIPPSLTSNMSSVSDQLNVAAKHISHPPRQVEVRTIQPFPWPESVNQIHGWCKMAKKSKDSKSQVELCRRLLATLAVNDANLSQEQIKPKFRRHPSLHSRKDAPAPPHSLESSLLSLPSLSNTNTSNSTSTSTRTSMSSLSSSSSLSAFSTLVATSTPIAFAEQNRIRHVMMRECLRILKRQSIGQGLGKGGDSEAQFILANCYGVGHLGLTEDHKKAFQWYMQASKQAHPEATYRTAVCYELGIGTRKDGQRAMIFYRKSAHLAHAGSMYKLGIILLRGYYHTTPLPREAISWLQRAVSHIIANSDTITTPSQRKSTTTTSTTPSSLCSSPSSTSLSSEYLTNLRHRRSITVGTSSQALHHQAPHALHALAMIQMNGEVGDTTSLIADPGYAIELLHHAAKRDHIPSQLQLGQCFEHGKWVPIDEALSIYWFTRAAQLGSPEACMAISGWYLTGTTDNRILPPSDRQAYLWARRAITLSTAATHLADQCTMAKAHFAVAVFIERGMNLEDGLLDKKSSTKKARSWMLKAAALGHVGASRWLKAKKKNDGQKYI
ncbi:hypothetical protein BCR42DRAFT_404325 [Absidia repens]|uniref:HCP-like protein n=1 Tax=Absidia repens TaxID=90262 RepID=A0A1X2IW18_9FUNG|nr:hypothetical protein BCR42DRAFT_404325 [Absidia repens]